MELQYFNKMDVDIIQKKILSSDLSELLSWETIYLNNDIKVINYNNSENNIVCMIYYNNIFHSCNLDTKTFHLHSDGVDFGTKIESIKLRSNNLYSYLENLSRYLNDVNEQHDNYIFRKEKSRIIKKTDEFIWNPYLNLHIPDNYNFNSNELKQKAYEFYDLNGFDCQKLHITKEHIIEIIIKELQSLDNNDKFTLIIKDNMFDFDILFTSFINDKLTTELGQLGIEGIKMNIKLNPNLYPYFPPNISFKNKLDNNLDIAISKLSYFNPEAWNPTNTMYNMISGIHKILDENAKIYHIFDMEHEELESLIQNIINNNNIMLVNSTFSNINLDYIKIREVTNDKDDSKYWNSGIGYGHRGRNKWDINKFIEEKKVKNNQNLFLIKILYDSISISENKDSLANFIINSNLFNVLIYFIQQFNLVEIETTYELFNTIYNILFELKILTWPDLPTYELGLLAHSIKPLTDELMIYLKINTDITEARKTMFNSIIEFYDSIIKFDTSSQSDINLDEYCTEMKKYQFEGDGTEFIKYYYKELNNSDSPSKTCVSKLTKELATYNNALPMNVNSSIYIRYNSSNLQNMKALIIGPKDTPYENGCYIFDLFIPHNYPEVPPKISLQTTGGGTVRFNPNLYNNGKVCLSLLGTWSGEGGEKWNPNTSTLLQVFVSIQSFIFIENPYFNEPGYEKTINTQNGNNQNFKYNDERRYNNIKWAINDNIENPDPEFKNVILNHFKFKKNEIIDTINTWYSVTNLSKDNFNIVKNNCINLLDKI